MVSSPGFGSITRDLRPFQTRFPLGFALRELNRPRLITRRLILQQARGQTFHRPPTACKLTVSRSFSLPSPGFFSPFPRGTGSLSVTPEYLALPGGPG